jgi:hypothetical protein
VNERAGSLSDEELLTALAESFPVTQTEPDAASLHRLSMAVADLRRPRTGPTPTRTPAHAARPSRWALPRRLSPVVIAGAVVGVLGAGTGISYAVGVPIPAAVRSIARTVGLAKPTPTTLPPATTAPPATAAVQAARQAESTLHQALTQSHPPLAVISHDTTVLAHRLAQVGGHPTPGAAGATADGQHLLNEACRQLEGSGPADPGGTNAATPSGTSGYGSPVGVTCTPGPVGTYPSEPASPSSTVPTTTRTTELPSPSHPGAGTSGNPVKATNGGSPGTSTGTSSGQYPQGSSGHSDQSTPSVSQPHSESRSGATYPRSSDTSH